MTGQTCGFLAVAAAGQGSVPYSELLINVATAAWAGAMYLASVLLDSWWNQETGDDPPNPAGPLVTSVLLAAACCAMPYVLSMPPNWQQGKIPLLGLFFAFALSIVRVAAFRMRGPLSRMMAITIGIMGPLLAVGLAFGSVFFFLAEREELWRRLELLVLVCGAPVLAHLSEVARAERARARLSEDGLEAGKSRGGDASARQSTGESEGVR